MLLAELGPLEFMIAYVLLSLGGFSIIVFLIQLVFKDFNAESKFFWIFFCIYMAYLTGYMIIVPKIIPVGWVRRALGLSQKTLIIIFMGLLALVAIIKTRKKK